MGRVFGWSASGEDPTVPLSRVHTDAACHAACDACHEIFADDQPLLEYSSSPNKLTSYMSRIAGEVLLNDWSCNRTYIELTYIILELSQQPLNKSMSKTLIKPAATMRPRYSTL
eukprot:123756-Hanusia_phi.AAC.1